MKKTGGLLWISFCLLLIGLTPVQAQQGFFLDFTGALTDCASWINSVGGGSLHAIGSGLDTILFSNSAGGAAPECYDTVTDSLQIELIGFTTSSFSMLTPVGSGHNVSLYAGGLGGTLVYTTSTSGSVSYSGADYDFVYILFNSGVVDNITIGTPPGTSYNPPRLNGGDWGSPVALYCTIGGGLDIYNIVDDQGMFAHRISDQELANAIATATDSGNNVRLISASGAELWVLSSGEIQINAESYTYDFAYQSVCGALPEPALVSSTVEDEEDVGVIIDEPR